MKPCSPRGEAPRWPVSRSLHSRRSAAPGTRRDGLGHRRSVPAPVAVGGRAYTSVPPLRPPAPTASSLRLPSPGPNHRLGQLAACLAPRLYGSLAPPRSCVPRDPDASTIDRARSAMRRRLRVTLALYTPGAGMVASFRRFWCSLICNADFLDHDFEDGRLIVSRQ